MGFYLPYGSLAYLGAHHRGRRPANATRLCGSLLSGRAVGLPRGWAKALR